MLDDPLIGIRQRNSFDSYDMFTRNFQPSIEHEMMRVIVSLQLDLLETAANHMRIHVAGMSLRPTILKSSQERRRRNKKSKRAPVPVVANSMASW